MLGCLANTTRLAYLAFSYSHTLKVNKKMILILFIILIRILPFVWIHNPVFWLKNLLFSKKVEIEQFTLHIQSKKVERTKKEGLTSNSRNTKTETVQLASNSLKRVFRRSVRPPVCPLVHVRKKPPIGGRNF